MPSKPDYTPTIGGQPHLSHDEPMLSVAATLDHLYQYISGPDPLVHAKAIRVIGQLTPSSDFERILIATRLIEAANNSDPRIRLTGVQGMGNLDFPARAEILSIIAHRHAHYQRRPYSLIYPSAIHALAQIYTEDSKRELLQFATDGSQLAWNELLTLEEPELGQALAHNLLYGHEDTTRRAAATTFSHMNPAQAAAYLPYLTIATYYDRNIHVRLDATYSLVSIGHNSPPEIQRFCDTIMGTSINDPRIVALIASLGTPQSKQAIEILASSLYRQHQRSYISPEVSYTALARLDSH